MNLRFLTAPTGLLLIVGMTASVSAQATPDQQFLQEMANNNEGVALLAHETLHRPGTFPSKTQAQAVDKQHDDQMDHLRAALKMLNDNYVPRASHADSAVAAALRAKSHAAYDSAFRADVVRLDQRATELVDKYLPQLTNVQIKTLAQRMRDATAEEEKQLGG
jgi:uncharacterized protein YqeY